MNDDVLANLAYTHVDSVQTFATGIYTSWFGLADRGAAAQLALGLLGFASYAIEQRRKEIGIRKVLGASLLQIVGMLFQDIFYLILVASMLGAVIAFVVVQIWLQQYAYHAEIPVATFFFAGILAMVLAFLTVSFHSMRAALANPVGALKYE